MTSSIQLQFSHLRCELCPALGGSVAGLWLGDTPVLASTAASSLVSARTAGSYPLVPYSNRIAQAAFQWAGKSYALTPNFAPEPHAIHGVGWERAWQTLDAHAHHARLFYAHTPDAGWPFAFEATQTFHLSGNTLSQSLSVTNLADHVAPVGLGWHPYFVKRRHSQIRFECTGRWAMDTHQLPTQLLPVPGVQADLGTLEVDHCHEGWNGEVHLTDALLNIRINSALSRLVVYCQPGRDSIAIEPVSHVNNALGMQHLASPEQLGVQLLAPGQSFSSQMRIYVEHAQ